jgi:uncharacterized OB-fold protein
MTRWFPNSMPQPMADNASVPWWQAAAEHKLMVQRCTDCALQRLPAAPICSSCRSDGADWQEISGRGQLYTYTIVQRAMAADLQLPFVIAVIDLEGAEGVRIISNMVDTPVETLEIGMAVEVVWEDMGPELAIPRFRART